MTDEEIRQKYNSFTPEQRNMSFPEFKKQIKDLTNPTKMQQDLGDIQLQKAIFRTNKIRIDRKIN